MKQTDPQMKIRLPAALKAEVEAAASLNNRSMNSEIVSRLEASFDAISTKPFVERLNSVSDSFKLLSIDMIQISSYIRSLEAYLDIVDPGGPRPEAPKSILDDELFRSIKNKLT